MSDDQTPQDDAAEQLIVEDINDFADFAITELQILANKYSRPREVELAALKVFNEKMLVDKGVIELEHVEEFMTSFDHLVKLYAERKQKGGS